MSNLNYLYDDEVLDGVLLVDLSQIGLSTAMATFHKGEKIPVAEVRSLILSSLKHNVLKFKSEGFKEIIICVDNAKFGYWRRQFADYYKRNRAISREENKNDFDWDGYFEGLTTTLAELKEFMPYYVIDVKHAEADDCIAVLTKYFTTVKRMKVRICSSDGDFTQLHKFPNVDQWSPIQKKFVTVKTSSPEEDKLTKIIKGDKKDCVASIKVKGDFYLCDIDKNTPSTATEFISECVGKSESELMEVFKRDIESKIFGIKSGKKWAFKELELLTPEYIEPSMEKDELFELVHRHRVKDQLITFYGVEESKAYTIAFEKSYEQLITLLAQIRMKRFKENQVLIDFDYIRQDIQDAIMAEYASYKPAPRGKMYSYFVRFGLVKLLPHINDF